MTTEREMSLEEFLAQELPEFHLARQQLGELQAKLEAARRECGEYRRDLAHQDCQLQKLRTGLLNISALPGCEAARIARETLDESYRFDRKHREP